MSYSDRWDDASKKRQNAFVISGKKFRYLLALYGITAVSVGIAIAYHFGGVPCLP